MKQELYEKLAAYIIENQDKFYRLAFSYVKNQEDALDAVQNSVCKALEHYESLRNENAIKTWFYRIVINESIALLNAKKRLVLADDDQHWEIPYEEAGFQIHDDLYDEINQLEKDVQNIIKLRFYEELSLNEIARVLKMKRRGRSRGYRLFRRGGWFSRRYRIRQDSWHGGRIASEGLRLAGGIRHSMRVLRSCQRKSSCGVANL